MGTSYHIGVTGVQGRMGQMLATLLQERQDQKAFIYSGGATRHKNVRDIEGQDHYLDVSDLFKNSDCVIDFTKPEALENHLNLSVKNATSLVIGTTGLDEGQEDMIAQAAQNVPIVYAPNMSVGVNVMLAMVEKAARLLDEEYDIEIFEAHHRHKVDSPSGTALAIGKAAAQGRGVGFEEKSVSNMGNRDGERQAGDIGFSVMRGGEIIGEHVAGFYGAHERFEIKHMAQDRRLFADGALKAALWLKGKPAGLYNMRDVLGL